MAQITTQLLVSQQTHPGDSSVQTVTGSAVKGNGYYGQADGRHTALFSVTGFTGTITIQGSLVTSPSSQTGQTLLYFLMVQHKKTAIQQLTSQVTLYGYVLLLNIQTAQ